MAGMAVDTGAVERPGKQIAACEHNSRHHDTLCRLERSHAVCGHPPVAQPVRGAGRHVAVLLTMGGFLLLAKG